VIVPHRVCGIGLLVAALASAPLPAHAVTQTPTELLTQGDAKASDGQHAEAARLYHEAYMKMSADERADMGELVVEAALESVRKAWNKSEDPALLELTADLIEDFESDMSGTAPEFIDEARVWLAERQPEEPPEDDGGDDAGGDDIWTDDDPVDIGTGTTTDTGEDPGKEIVGPVLIGAGGALLVGGVVLLAVGAPIGGKAEDARDDAFASEELMALENGSMADMMMATEFRDNYDTYVEDEKKRGRGMMIGGGILLGVGVGLAAYGVVRLVQHKKKKRASQARLQVLPRSGGLTVRF
jgi:hypothetical protein